MSQKKKIILLLADITNIAVNAMVNPANKSMLAGSGLCGLIHKKAGKELTDACLDYHQQQRFYYVGDVLATPAGKLPAKYVLHAVSPKWHEEEDKAKSLLKVYEHILIVTDALELKTVSIPAISTGINGYPKQFAADVALEGLVELLPNFKNLENVLVVCTDKDSAQAYNQKAKEINSEYVQIVNLFPSVLCDT